MNGRMFDVKRMILMALTFVFVFGATHAEQITTSQYMQSKGYAVYQVGGVADIGLDESLFDGSNAAYTLCGCIYVANEKLYNFFWRESDGSVYVARSLGQAMANAISPFLSAMGTIQQFTDMCKDCGFSLALYLDGGYFTFGMADENDDLIDIAKRIADGQPMTYRVGWENYLKAITLPGLY